MNRQAVTPATATASTEREEEGTVVLLSFLWFQWTIYYASHPIYNTNSDVTLSQMV